MSSREMTAEEGRDIFHWLLQDTMDGLRRRRRALLGYLLLIAHLTWHLHIYRRSNFRISFGLSLFRWNIFKPPDFMSPWKILNV